MKKQVGTIDLTPTPTGYAICLMEILEDGNFENKKWAREEIIRLIKAAATIKPEAWGKEENKCQV